MVVRAKLAEIFPPSFEMAINAAVVLDSVQQTAFKVRCVLARVCARVSGVRGCVSRVRACVSRVRACVSRVRASMLLRVCVCVCVGVCVLARRVWVCAHACMRAREKASEEGTNNVVRTA